jgi:hypothetical protein
MCATLLHLGLSSLSVLIQGSAHHAHIGFLWYVPGVLALPLAFLLFTRSPVVARLAFAFLLVATLVNVASPLVGMISKSAPPVPTLSSLFYAFIYGFPCLAAVLVARRDVHRSV